MPADTTSDLLTLVNAIPTAQEGQIISSNYHNSMLAALRAIVNQMNTVPAPTSTPFINSGFVDREDFRTPPKGESSDFFEEELLTTRAISHGLGTGSVAIIIGVESENDRQLGAQDLYFAFANMSSVRMNIVLYAAVPKTNARSFVLVASKGALEMFKRFHWWAIKA